MSSSPAPDMARTVQAAPISRRAVGTTMGSALIAAVAYIDPGNFATNVTAGARFGPMLVWVVVAASAVGLLVQYLASKLGLVTGRSLPEHCRERMPSWARVGMWLQAELVVIMTDLAEVVGGAIALHLLFGVPMLAGATAMVLTSLAVLGLKVNGYSLFRPVVYAGLATVAAAFGYQVLHADLGAGELASGLIPRLQGIDSAYLAAGVVGATVMPHVVYLHSDMTKTELAVSGRAVPELLRRSRREISAAMLVAASINVCIMLAATTLGAQQAGSLADAHAGFASVMGAAAGWAFALALLASSLASTCVGVYSGQAIMAGFLRRHVSAWLLRCVSAVPALAVLAAGVDPTAALVLSQVALSFGIPLALAPLLWLTSSSTVMGSAANTSLTVGAIGTVLGLVIGLNVFLTGSLLIG
ncbi:Nramp family divalent metal transporter [Kineosporia mesophila]|uniref:Nramp family divalent metal transporter n=1 Tax=Kineosporia mesophila TaxID=566012 RepID=A0ABP6ZS86_9ACTN|nr:Nramp family divalent metal transporter [Kineosporia mesophila]MCD5354454.1 Nramp family divalent metal transporter [Kineosporia mesophila]